MYLPPVKGNHYSHSNLITTTLDVTPLPPSPKKPIAINSSGTT